jgi:hypothetical protein
MPALYLNTGREAGDEISSTYEGRHLTLEESYLIHPYHADGLVDKGDPVLFAVGSGWMNGVGVALGSATVATDLIAIDTEGIWFLNVLGAVSDGTNNGAARALAAGDPVYICKTVDQVITLSGKDDPHEWVPFGYLLGDVAASITATTIVAVKVHWAPNFLDTINVGTLTLVNQVVVSHNHEIDVAGFRAAAGGEVQESWGREYAWLKAFIGLKAPLNVDEDMCGIYVRLEDNQHTTGGDLYAGRFQTHANHATAVWTRLYGLYVAISNEVSGTITESFGVSINMGGAGCAPATQAAIQIMGDGTLGTLQGWFQTEIGRGAGLKAEASSINVNRAFEIPIIINGVRYCIPVIAWI